MNKMRNPLSRAVMLAKGVNLEGISEISRRRFRDDKMDVGPRSLFHFEYSSMAKWMLGPVHFHDDKSGDGLRTLFHFGRFATMAPEHFSVLEISRR